MSSSSTPARPAPSAATASPSPSAPAPAAVSAASISPSASASDSVLAVRSVDLLRLRDGLNRRQHHTDGFSSERLIVRRGQSFQITVELSRAFKPRETKTIPWTLQYKEYKEQLVDQGALMLTLTGRVSQTKQVLATQFNFRLRTPDLVLTPLQDAVVGKEMSVRISFQNPLSQVLKNVLFRIEGLGMQSVRKISYGDVARLGTVSLIEKFTPTVSGSQKLLASMDCRQLTQVHGVADITVKAK